MLLQGKWSVNAGQERVALVVFVILTEVDDARLAMKAKVRFSSTSTSVHGTPDLVLMVLWLVFLQQGVGIQRLIYITLQPLPSTSIEPKEPFHQLEAASTVETRPTFLTLFVVIDPNCERGAILTSLACCCCRCRQLL